MARLRFEGLSHRYGTDQPWVLQDLHLDVADGEAHALLGPSGAGKSTLLSLLSGLLVPTDGRVLLDDVDVTRVPVRGRNIAQVFQFPVVYDGLSVRGNLEFPLRTGRMKAGVVRARVDAIAALLEITHLLGTQPARLSAYDRQTVAMARALVRPDVAAVLLDEPLTAVEPAIRWRLRRALKAVQRELGTTMIYVTHDQLEALTFADRVSVIESGRILQCGPPASLFDDPAHAFVGHFIGSPGMNLLPVRLSGDRVLLQGSPVPVRPADACTSPGGAADEAVLLGFRPEDGQVMAPGAAGGEAALPSTAGPAALQPKLDVAVDVRQVRPLGLRGGVPWGTVQAHLQESVSGAPGDGAARGGSGDPAVATALQIRQVVAGLTPGPATLQVDATRLRLFRGGWRLRTEIVRHG